MNELSLFSGAGGGLLGTKLLGWNHIGYVEYNDYCQRIIRQRIDDGIFDAAPIFGDIRTFISEGYARSYQGVANIISAGFPCQPFSTAGKRAGDQDERNMWPATLECLRIIRPRYALFENVPGLLTHEYGRTVFRELAESGYQCRWRVLSAAELGAPHKRDRLWIVAYTDDYGCTAGEVTEGNTKRADDQPTRTKATSQLAGCCRKQFSIADVECIGQWNREASDEGRQWQYGAHCDRNISSINDTDYHSKRTQGSAETSLSWEQDMPWGESIRGYENIKERSDIPEPLFCRMDDGMAYRSHRLKAIGNGQVPAVVRAAWYLLSQGI